jgi:tripartite ATP-independent transporter DctM subunit
MIILFGLFFFLMLTGMPVGFSLMSSSIVYMIFNNLPLTMVAQKLETGVESFPLIAIAFFILAGSVMNSAGITKRIFAFADCLVGHFTGGMGHANIIASVIFSGMSGSAIADAGGLGAVEMKAMLEANYDEDFSVAVTGASAIIGPIIPPSIPMVIFAVTSGVSTGRLFVGGIIPGLIMASTLGVVVYILCKKKNYKKKPRATFRHFVQTLRASFLSIVTPVIIIGGILMGIFTPTEASIIAVAYALLLGLAYGDIKIMDIPHFLRETLKVTTGILFIIGAAALFGWLLTISQAPQIIAQTFGDIFRNKYVALLMFNILFLILGCVMDSDPIMIILVPILMPMIQNYGIDPVHFGVVMTVNLMIGLLTPPVGLVLYTLSGVTNVSVERICKAIWPFLIAQFACVLLLTYVPELVTFLPNLVYGVR